MSPIPASRSRIAPGPMLAAALTLFLAAAPAAAQSLLQRTPNLTGGWVATPGTLVLDAFNRYRSVDGLELAGLPTVIAAYGLPGNLLAGATFATQSPVVIGQSTELEPFVRWAPMLERPDRPLQLAAMVALNTASVSVDGEVEAAYRRGGTRLLGALRLFLDGYSDGLALAPAAGVVWQPLRGRVPVALAADLGALLGEDRGETLVWSAGVSAGLPVSTATAALYVTNATSGTLEGRSLGFSRVRFGLQLTVESPIGEQLGVFVPRAVAAHAVQPAPPEEEDTAREERRVVRVDVREFAFIEQRLEIARGTTVEWVNRDAVVHTATSDDGSWNSGAIEPGASWSATFNEPGIYSYHCGPHPYMRGTIRVR
ncbi:MAG TPA: cupredoxin family copper-binding protein [Longimicrobiales bacterium]